MDKTRHNPRMIRWFLALPILLSACLKDETISGYIDPLTTYELIELDGQPFTARATISFPIEGSVKGQAPCNTYAARQSKPYPWIGVTAIRSTLSICPDMVAEGQFFEALGQMETSEALGGTLVLRGSDGNEMVFQALPR